MRTKFFVLVLFVAFGLTANAQVVNNVEKELAKKEAVKEAGPKAAKKEACGKAAVKEAGPKAAVKEACGKAAVKEAGPKAAKKDSHVGRNDLCPCGSGKKYKQCCGK